MSQSLSKLYVHLVFSTKERRDILPKAHLHEVWAYVAGILKVLNCQPLAVGGTSNHIHILFIQNRTITLSDVVREVKAKSSKWMNGKNCILSSFCWQDGYGAFSISRSHVEAVKGYIGRQEEHHHVITYQEEFRRLCTIYDAGLDERYAWD